MNLTRLGCKLVNAVCEDSVRPVPGLPSAGRHEVEQTPRIFGAAKTRKVLDDQVPDDVPDPTRRSPNGYRTPVSRSHPAQT